ncbi:hypothetical protein RFI_32030 [Reticulomyxa filosa]|uniref:Uncharacterized protein n=1 Tax=Reticulomyxa filosa TaxID=46433 RepID=X6LVK0_RETFI|nr:hypothetical protein RFI_32030 [Reticulomyxa filosa]|eukprot:ETO05366.1 hypothetical protein RFI_32030 [Reticulomyxa filosa]
MTQIYEFKKLNRIIGGDGAEIREQLILAGLLLMLFERFKKYTLGQVEGFFCSHIEFKEGDIVYRRGDKFKKLIKEHGKGEDGQHGNEAFRAALKLFRDFDAISAEEFNEIERLYILRNDIGHELFAIIADDNKHPIKVEDICTIFDVYLKIVRWWIKEIEATTDPDFDQEKYENTDFDSAESGDTVFLREIIKKALLGNADINEILKAANG